jgi:membrane protein implicated in regulation of membrane protease activity
MNELILSGIMLTTVGFAALAIGISWLLLRKASNHVSGEQRGEDKDLNVNK